MQEWSHHVVQSCTQTQPLREVKEVLLWFRSDSNPVDALTPDFWPQDLEGTRFRGLQGPVRGILLCQSSEVGGQKPEAMPRFRSLGSV